MQAMTLGKSAPVSGVRIMRRTVDARQRAEQAGTPSWTTRYARTAAVASLSEAPLNTNIPITLPSVPATPVGVGIREPAWPRV